MVQRTAGSEWDEPERVASFTGRVTPGRADGERALCELLPQDRPCRTLDLGTGDGRMLRVVASAVPSTGVVGLDRSAAMLARARAHPGNDPSWTFAEHDLALALPDLGPFDVVTSGLALHHLNDSRKRRIAEEVHATLAPGGVFLNLDVVRLGSAALDAAFLHAIGRDDGGDPSDRPSTVLEHSTWLSDAGFVDVDCHWKWRGLAVVAGRVAGGR